MTVKNIWIEPTYPDFNNNNFFNLEDKILNRDNQLSSNFLFKKKLESKGFQVNTFDIISEKNIDDINLYLNFGSKFHPSQSQIEKFNLKKLCYIFFEHPTVYGNYSVALDNLKRYETIFLHNIDGDGYNLNHFRGFNLKKFYWSQTRDDVIEKYWNNTNRYNDFVMINGAHTPFNRKPEYYSRRIDYILNIGKYENFSLYGKGWDKIISRSNLWFKHLSNRSKILRFYKGPVSSKYTTYAKYNFSICIENAPMRGYITEKIFDCFYSGTIPFYLGAPDISDHIPKECYVDLRDFSKITDLIDFKNSLTKDDIQKFKDNARSFIISAEKYHPKGILQFFPEGSE